MRTTDQIITDLQARAAAGEDVRQQVISHETIARLRAELAGVDAAADPQRVRGLQMQIGTHLRMVDEQPAEDSAEQPAEGPGKGKRPAKA